MPAMLFRQSCEKCVFSVICQSRFQLPPPLNPLPLIAITEAWSIYAGLGFGVAKVSFDARTLRDTANHTTGDNTAFVANTFAPATKTAVVNALKAHDTQSAVKTELSKTVFAWQLMAGVGYEFSENWKLTLGYKLFNTAKVKLFGDKKIKTPFNHTAEVGLTYTF